MADWSCFLLHYAPFLAGNCLVSDRRHQPVVWQNDAILQVVGYRLEDGTTPLDTDNTVLTRTEMGGRFGRLSGDQRQQDGQ